MSDDGEQASLDVGEYEEEAESGVDDSINTDLDRTTLGEVPSDWESKRLKDLANGSLYGVAESAEDFDSEKLRYIRITDISEDGNLKDDEKKSLSEKDIDEKYLLQPDELLFARSGATVGKTYLYNENDPEATYGGYLIRFVPDSEKILPQYLFYYTQSDNYDDWITRVSRQGAQANVNAEEYKSILLPVPPLPEQRKIASVLYNVDEAIRKTEEIIKGTKRVKKGAIREAYNTGLHDEETVTTEFGEMPESWSLEKIEDVCQIGGGGTPKRSKDEYWGGEIPWATPKDFDKPRMSETEDYVTEKGIEESTTNVYEAGSTMLVVRSGILQRKLPVAKTVRTTAVNQDIKVLTPNEERVYPDYLFQIISTMSNDVRGRCKKVGTTVESIQTAALEKYKLKLPDIEEQKRIAEIGEDFDDNVIAEERILDQLKMLKRGLMQDLLTGEVRTADRDIDVLPEVEAHG